MQTFWIRPVLAALFWLLAVSATLAELGTLPPSIHAAGQHQAMRQGMTPRAHRSAR